MASKITGAQVEYDANAPLIDVDTAIEDLAEDLSRSGRRRQLIALQHLCSAARRSVLPWRVYDGRSDPATEREIDLMNVETRVIVLVPINAEETEMRDPDMDRHVEVAEERIREDGRR